MNYLQIIKVIAKVASAVFQGWQDGRKRKQEDKKTLPYKHVAHQQAQIKSATSFKVTHENDSKKNP